MLVGHVDYLVHVTWDVRLVLVTGMIVFCSGIRRECDGGTAWERVEMGDCPLTPPSEDIQVKLFQVGVSIHWTGLLD